MAVGCFGLADGFQRQKELGFFPTNSRNMRLADQAGLGTIYATSCLGGSGQVVRAGMEAGGRGKPEKGRRLCGRGLILCGLGY